MSKRPHPILDRTEREVQRALKAHVHYFRTVRIPQAKTRADSRTETRSRSRTETRPQRPEPKTPSPPPSKPAEAPKDGPVVQLRDTRPVAGRRFFVYNLILVLLLLSVCGYLLYLNVTTLD